MCLLCGWDHEVLGDPRGTKRTRNQYSQSSCVRGKINMKQTYREIKNFKFSQVILETNRMLEGNNAKAPLSIVWWREAWGGGYAGPQPAQKVPSTRPSCVPSPKKRKCVFPSPFIVSLNYSGALVPSLQFSINQAQFLVFPVFFFSSNCWLSPVAFGIRQIWVKIPLTNCVPQAIFFIC